jgi:hypothetical protein
MIISHQAIDSLAAFSNELIAQSARVGTISEIFIFM